jgi:predicted PurR-regulated permease PerM
MPFFYGFAATYILLQPYWWPEKPEILSAVIGILIEFFAFVFAGFVGCISRPTHPFSSAALGITGVIVGVVVDSCLMLARKHAAQPNLAVKALPSVAGSRRKRRAPYHKR